MKNDTKILDEMILHFIRYLLLSGYVYPKNHKIVLKLLSDMKKNYKMDIALSPMMDILNFAILLLSDQILIFILIIEYLIRENYL